ncbi:hypothetical protein C2845_PM11G01610 [Panicum miliaceum]|uniref:Uncharacterized protein n=1 Tax=Panicum miliaceum TaxID=4540 RepID=A0A3L6RTA7_PANMI|nr:hypothetical protein C2845_PM11G01610 [Panicum miliaceum]
MSQDRDGATRPKDATGRIPLDRIPGGSATGTARPRENGSRAPSIYDSASSEETSESDELEGEDVEARKRRKEKMKAKIEKKAERMVKKRIKQEMEKHPFFGMHQVPPNYPQSQYPASQFQSVQLGKAPFFDGTDYPKWSYDMQMHLYAFHPSVWEVVVVSVTPPRNGIPTAEQSQDYFRNAQAVRVITSPFVLKSSTRSATFKWSRRYETL